MVFKQLGWGCLGEDARLAKPRFLHDPRRELAAYASLLEPAVGGPPRYFGSSVDAERDRYWLFIERVDGRELFQVGERGLWEEAARWLARMHGGLADDVERYRESAHLIDHGPAFYRRWMERASEFAGVSGEPESDARAVDWIRERHEAVVESLLELPKTVIHGEFYASNVLIGGEPEAPRVAPVDWELAACGPGLTDLAALVSGDWSSEDREAIVSAYAATLGAEIAPRSLMLVRLQLAIQWLGWAPPSWIPPEGQRHDWLAEALALAEELEL
jgi:aminoglycoside phosphotransferase (APT) family kinase protein